MYRLRDCEIKPSQDSLLCIVWKFVEKPNRGKFAWGGGLLGLKIRSRPVVMKEEEKGRKIKSLDIIIYVGRIWRLGYQKEELKLF